MLAQLDAGGLDADARPVRGSPYTRPALVVGRCLRCAAAGERDPQSLGACLDGRDARARPHVLVSARDPLLERLDEIAIAPGHQTLGELDDADLDPERLVNGRHLEPDDAAADHQQRSGQVELERAGRIDDPRVVGKPGEAYRLGARRDDALREAHRTRVAPARNPQFMRPGELTVALDHRDLALARKAGEAASQPVHDAVLPFAQPGHVDTRLAEGDTVRGHRIRFFDDARRMQQRLRWDATDVETHTAELRPPLDQRDLEAEIGGAKSSRVSARARTQHREIEVIRRGRDRGSGRRRGRGRRPRRYGSTLFPGSAGVFHRCDRHRIHVWLAAEGFRFAQGLVWRGFVLARWSRRTAGRLPGRAQPSNHAAGVDLFARTDREPRL